MPKRTTRGQTFEQAVRASYDLLSPAEELLLVELASVIDTIDSLPDDRVSEIRQQRVLLSRLLNQLALPSEDGTPLALVRKGSARRAAEARWSRAKG